VSSWAVLAAAGSGERLGADRPKAFVRLGDRVLLAESVERLDASDWIDAIVVAAPPGWEEPAILLAEELGCSKVSACIAGGATRGESVRLALAEVPGDAAVVVVHDAARPFVVDEVIGRVLEALGTASLRPSTVRSFGSSRRRRHSLRPSCATPSQATSPRRATARLWWRRAAAA